MNKRPSALARIMTVASLTGLILLGSPRHSASQGRNPFVDRSDTGEIVHVLPTPASIHSPHDTGPTIAPPANEAKAYPASYGTGLLLSNHGGPVIGNAGFWALYWNSSVATATQTSINQLTNAKYASLREQMDAFLINFGTGAQYSQAPTDDFSIVQQYGAPITSTVKYWGFRIASERTKSSVSDGGIRNFIAGQLGSGTMTVDTNIIYGVYLPPGMKVTMSGGASCSTFCGYHSHFNYGGLDIRYAVFPYLDCNACKLSTLSVADMMTIVASHEIREAVTDPQLNAWYDDQGYEADDKCAWHNLYRMTNGGLWVQPEFSNGGTTTPDGVSYPGPGCVVPNQP
jgi:hypothetical protein